jgi:hypothetical protein
MAKISLVLAFLAGMVVLPLPPVQDSHQRNMEQRDLVRLGRLAVDHAGKLQPIL